MKVNTFVLFASIIFCLVQNSTSYAEKCSAKDVLKMINTGFSKERIDELCGETDSSSLKLPPTSKQSPSEQSDSASTVLSSKSFSSLHGFWVCLNTQIKPRIGYDPYKSFDAMEITDLNIYNSFVLYPTGLLIIGSTTPGKLIKTKTGFQSKHRTYSLLFDVDWLRRDEIIYIRRDKSGTEYSWEKRCIKLPRYTFRAPTHMEREYTINYYRRFTSFTFGTEAEDPLLSDIRKSNSLVNSSNLHQILDRLCTRRYKEQPVCR